MKHKVVIGTGTAAGLLCWLLVLASGYFVDPALFPFGASYPLVLVFLAAVSVLVGITYALGCLGRSILEKSPRYIAVASVALVGPLIVAGGPRLLGSYDAFVYRMESYPAAEYQRLAADIRAALDEKGVRYFQEVASPGEAETPHSLIEAHRVLRVSEFPMDIAGGEENVSVRWSSGLTGGYRIAIWLGADPPAGWADGLRAGDYDLPVTYIYDGVAAGIDP